MDEPLSNLDAKLRVGMRASLAQLHQRLGVTTVYVTHDQVEAMTLGQRVAVMRDGQILQVDTPQALYERPVDLFVAGFIGSPVDEPRRRGGRGRRGRVRPVPGSTRPVAPPRALDPGASWSGSGRRRSRTRRSLLPAFRPSTSTWSSSRSSARTRTSTSTSTRPASRQAPWTRKTTRAQSSPTTVGALLNARVDPRTAARVGGSLRLAVDPARFHFFDADSGLSLLRPKAAAAEEPLIQAAVSPWS